MLPQCPTVQLPLNRAKYLKIDVSGGGRIATGGRAAGRSHPSVVLDVGDEESCPVDKHRVSDWHDSFNRHDIQYRTCTKSRPTLQDGSRFQVI